MILHFTFIIIYTNPIQHAKQKLDYYAEWYAYPYFTQNWNLFAPSPNTNYNLFVEYENNGLQRTDVFQEILLQHQSNRFMGNGALLLAFSNSLYYFEKNTKEKNLLNGPIKSDLYFQILEQEALNYIRSTRKIKIESIKLRLLLHSTDTGKRKVYFN